MFGRDKLLKFCRAFGELTHLSITGVAARESRSDALNIFGFLDDSFTVRYSGKTLSTIASREETVLSTPSPDAFFTAQSFSTVAGASAMVFFVSNALQKALDFNPRWLALVLSELIVLAGTYINHTAQVPSDYLLAVLNGCVVYCAAVGGATVAGAAREKGAPRGAVPPAKARRRFTEAWF